jgi:hypothetical protein
MNYGLKEASLAVGALFVSMGGRMLIEGDVLALPVVILAGLLFLMGQSITRFEDFPNGRQNLNQIEAWLVEKHVLGFSKAALPEQNQQVKPPEA